jgi:hypothetical protein
VELRQRSPGLAQALSARPKVCGARQNLIVLYVMKFLKSIRYVCDKAASSSRQRRPYTAAMLLVTWNVNSLKARLPRLLDVAGLIRFGRVGSMPAYASSVCGACYEYAR